MGLISTLLINLKANTASFEKGLGRSRKQLSAFEKKMAKLQKFGATMTKRFTLPIVAGLALATRAAAIQEEADIKLMSALKGVGDASKQTYNEMKKLASAIQKVTVYGDEMTQELMGVALNMGVNTSQMETAIKTAIGLSEAFGLDLNMAMRGTALAFQGQFTLLNRYIPALQVAEDETEKMTILQEAAAKGFQQAQDKTKGATGSLTQMKNTLGDVSEKLGAALLPAIKTVAGAISSMGSFLDNTSSGFQKFVSWSLLSAATVGPVALGVSSLTKAVRGLNVAYVALNSTIKLSAAMLGAVGGAALGIYGVATEVVSPIAKMEERGRKAGIKDKDMPKRNILDYLGASSRLKDVEELTAPTRMKYDRMMEQRKLESQIGASFGSVPAQGGTGQQQVYDPAMARELQTLNHNMQELIRNTDPNSANQAKVGDVGGY